MIEQLQHTWWLILLSVASGVFGQTFIKLGVEHPNAAEMDQGLFGLLSAIVTSPRVLLGLFFYGCGALAWILVLRRMDLSYAYPFLALNFVLITLVSRFFLGETVPPMRWFGILIICSGILLVARSTAQ